MFQAGRKSQTVPSCSHKCTPEPVHSVTFAAHVKGEDRIGFVRFLPKIWLYYSFLGLCVILSGGCSVDAQEENTVGLFSFPGHKYNCPKFHLQQSAGVLGSSRLSADKLSKGSSLFNGQQTQKSKDLMKQTGSNRRNGDHMLVFIQEK